MDQETIRKIAEEVAQYSSYPWSFWITQVLITLVAAGVGAFFSEYLKTRGKNLATKADFKPLQAQLSAQTTVVETIRAEIGQKDWAAREWANVRRVKLEELLNKVAECDGYRERLRRAALARENLNEHRDYADELSSLASLYFPELKEQVVTYKLLHRELSVVTHQFGLDLMVAGTDAAEAAADAKYLGKFSNLLPRIRDASSALDEAAHRLMLEIAGQSGK